MNVYDGASGDSFCLCCSLLYLQFPFEPLLTVYVAGFRLSVLYCGLIALLETKPNRLPCFRSGFTARDLVVNQVGLLNILLALVCMQVMCHRNRRERQNQYARRGK